MARGKAISDEVRAKVIAEVLAGAGVSDISRKLKLPKATISRIKNEQLPQKLEQVGTEKAARMDDLICRHLEANIEAQMRIAGYVSDEKYIRNQPASQVAELLDKLAATTFRILEAESAPEVEDD